MANISLFRERPPIDAFDYCSDVGAKVLQARIEDYWKARGHHIQITLHHAGFIAAMRSARTDIRSDMINGRPKGAALPSQKRSAA